jgi:hypothetical protein
LVLGEVWGGQGGKEVGSDPRGVVKARTGEDGLEIDEVYRNCMTGLDSR